MVKVLGAVSGKVAKSGRNTHQKYNYVMEADLLDAVRSELISHGIFVFSSVESVVHEAGLTTVRTKHTFVDADSGESFDVFSAGQGADKQDKGVYKAITGSSKYFLMKNFMVAGDDDPESDTTVSVTPNAAPKPISKPTTSKPKAAGFGKKSGSFSGKAVSGFGKSPEKAVEKLDVAETPVESTADRPF